MAIYALRVDDGWPWLVRHWLENGEGRFGWSYAETANLHDLRDRIAAEGWNGLDDAEKDCYHELLLSLNSGDYVVYVNVPEWGRCTLAEVTGTYFWRWADNDFNHRFPVDPDSVHTFDRNGPMVAPALGARLKLRGRCWRVHAEEEFMSLVEALRRGAKPAPGILGDHPYGLADEMKPSLSNVTEKIRRMRPHTDLERLVEQVLRRVPGVRSVTRLARPGDRGADLVVELELDSIPALVQTLVVQVRPGQGTLTAASAVDDLRRALGACDADMALIVSAAADRNPAVESELDRLREDTMKPVGLLVGDALAAFFLRHAPDLLPE